MRSLFLNIFILFVFLLVIAGTVALMGREVPYLSKYYCTLTGGSWESQTKGPYYCRRIYSDGGKKCETNMNCQSGKCVVEIVKDSKDPVSTNLNDMGRVENMTTGVCSDNNQDSCHSGEVLIEFTRKIRKPFSCE